MDPGYTKADDRNLPRVNILMVGNFFATNPDYCATEFRNVKTSVSARQSYGDDAIGYVQLRRDSDTCTIKCRVCPEHKVRSKSYAATMIVDEKEEKVLSVQCHDCPASTGGCKHTVAFLMWVHRRSEEPSTTETQCYWKKSKLAEVGTSVKYITAKDMSAGKRPCSSSSAILQNDILDQFFQASAERGLSSCELLKYYNYNREEHEKCSLHYLVMEHSKADNCDMFLTTIAQYFTKSNINKIEMNTRAQYKSRLWHEMRYGRITASKAYEVSKCRTGDGSLIAMIMGAKTPDTKAMRRGRNLENEVKVVVEQKLGKKVKECGLFISAEYPFIACSPDGICENNSFCIEIKCPTSQKTYTNYFKNNKVADKYMTQIQLQMFVTKLKKCYFCVADYNFETTNSVEILLVTYDETLVQHYISSISKFWQMYVYTVLHESTK